MLASLSLPLSSSLPMLLFLYPLFSFPLFPALFHSYVSATFSFFTPSNPPSLFFFPSLSIFQVSFHLVSISREQAIHERLRRSVKLVSTTNSEILKGIANAIGLKHVAPVTCCRAKTLGGWPSKHTRWHNALTWLLKRGFELF